MILFAALAHLVVVHLLQESKSQVLHKDNHRLHERSREQESVVASLEQRLARSEALITKMDDRRCVRTH